MSARTTNLRSSLTSITTTGPLLCIEATSFAVHASVVVVARSKGWKLLHTKQSSDNRFNHDFLDIHLAFSDRNVEDDEPGGADNGSNTEGPQPSYPVAFLI